MRRPTRSARFPYTTLFRSTEGGRAVERRVVQPPEHAEEEGDHRSCGEGRQRDRHALLLLRGGLHHGHRMLRACPVGKDRKSTRLNSSHANISYAVFCLKKT